MQRVENESLCLAYSNRNSFFYFRAILRHVDEFLRQNDGGMK